MPLMAFIMKFGLGMSYACSCNCNYSGTLCIFMHFCESETEWIVQQISRRGHCNQNGKACIRIVDDFGGKTDENWDGLHPLWCNISQSKHQKLENGDLWMQSFWISTSDYYFELKWLLIINLLYYLQTTWLESSNWTERPCGN